MAANEEQVKNALQDKDKQSRIAKFLTTLAGQDFSKIINAVNGTEQDFNTQLNAVQERTAQINQLQGKVAERDKQIADIDKEINQLKQRVSERDATIKTLMANRPDPKDIL